MTQLSPAARYQPWMNGRYETLPGLKPFRTDFGNGRLDQVLFQLDDELHSALENKRSAFAERKSKYLCRSQRQAPDVEQAAAKAIAKQLVDDWPEYFGVRGDRFFNLLAGTDSPLDLDSLVSQVAEDVALVSFEEDSDQICYLNLCSPSHWAAEDKIGLSFFDSHAPVPAFEKVRPIGRRLMQTIERVGPMVRFVWGLESDDRLNHHPIAPLGKNQDQWYGREFHRGLFVRTERQVLWPLLSTNGLLFTIRIHHTPFEALEPDARAALRDAVAGMSEEARIYKGLGSLQIPA